MKEYKVVINEEQVQVSALHIEAPTYKRIDNESLLRVINDWLMTIEFVSQLEIVDKNNDIVIKLNDNEVVQFIDNGCETIIIAYSTKYVYEVREYKHRKRDNRRH